MNRFKMGAGLASLASDTAHATTTFGVIAKQHGAADAERLLQSEIAKTLPAYQAQWDRNLADIYARHFSAEELRSLATQGTSSPHAGKFAAKQATVAMEMRTASSPLLQRFVTEVLAGAAKQ